MRRPPKPERFETFYFNNVATGEGCGCAERIIDVHEFKRKSAAPPVKRRMPALRYLKKLIGLLSFHRA